MHVPHIVDDTRAFRNRIAHVRIIPEDGVRYPKNDSWHPPQAFFNTASNVRQVVIVLDSWKPIMPNDPVHFLLRLLLYVRPHQQCQDEAIKDGSSRIGASLEQRAANVSGEIVGKLLSCLRPIDIVAKARLRGSVLSVCFRISRAEE